jgi:hypothetical protein
MSTAELSLSLFDIVHGQEELLALLDALDAPMERPEDVTDEQFAAMVQAKRQEVQGAISQLVEAEVRKVDDIARLVIHLEAIAEDVADEMKRLAARKKSLETRADLIRENVQRVLEGMGLKRRELQGTYHRLYLRKLPPELQIADENAIPDEFWKEETIRTLQRGELKKALKTRAVEGADLSFQDRFKLEIQ